MNRTPPMVLQAAALLLGACSGGTAEEGPRGACGNPARTEVSVMIELLFARRAEDGSTPGFDLDGHVTEPGSGLGCGHADLVSPDGTPGIDSALSGLVPALELTEAAAVEGLVQASINTGELLLLFEHSRVDDPDDDACVDLGLWRSTEDVPMVGTDGFLLDGQSFSRSEEVDPVVIEGVQRAAGTTVAGPFTMNLPFQVLDAQLDFHLTDAWIRVSTDADGATSGVLGGVIGIEQIVEIAVRDDVGIGDLVVPLVEAAADMYPDASGQCQGISSVFAFRGTKAFFYDDP